MSFKRAWFLFMIAFTVIYGMPNLHGCFSGPYRGMDFTQYYFAGRTLLSGHREDMYLGGSRLVENATAYGIRPIEGHVMRNAYPPFTAIFMVPIALLPYNVARLAFFYVSLAALVCAIPVLFGDRPQDIRWELSAIGWMAIFAYLPTYMILSMGQVNALLFLFCVLALAFIRQDRMALAGLFVSLACMIKIFPLILFPFFLLKRQYRLCMTSAMWLLAFLALSLVICGVRTWQIFLSVLLSQAYLGAHSLNQGFSGFFGRLLTPNPWVASVGNHPEIASFLTIFCGMLVLCLTFWYTKRALRVETMRYDLEFGLYFTASMLISGHALEHMSVFLLFSFLFIFESIVYHGCYAFWEFFLMSAAYCIWAFFQTPSTLHANLAMNIAYSAKFFASLLLFSANVLLMRRLEKAAYSRHGGQRTGVTTGCKSHEAGIARLMGKLQARIR